MYTRLVTWVIKSELVNWWTPIELYGYGTAVAASILSFVTFRILLLNAIMLPALLYTYTAFWLH